ncbi:MAG TPA: hypothetical protein VIL78_12355 [Hanamia sp.]
MQSILAATTSPVSNQNTIVITDKKIKYASPEIEPGRSENEARTIKILYE